MSGFEIFSLTFQDIATGFFYITLFNMAISQVYGFSLVHTAKFMWSYFYGRTSFARQVIYTSWMVCFLAAKLAYLKFKLRFFPTPPVKDTIEITPQGRNHIRVTYTYRNQVYSFITKVRRGPSSLGVVRCGDDDVSEKIREFSGPGDDYHGIRYTPRMLGFYEPLVFVDLMGDETVYELDDSLVKVY